MNWIGRCSSEEFCLRTYEMSRSWWFPFISLYMYISGNRTGNAMGKVRWTFSGIIYYPHILFLFHCVFKFKGFLVCHYTFSIVVFMAKKHQLRLYRDQYREALDPGPWVLHVVSWWLSSLWLEVIHFNKFELSEKKHLRKPLLLRRWSLLSSVLRQRISHLVSACRSFMFAISAYNQHSPALINLGYS